MNLLTQLFFALFVTLPGGYCLLRCLFQVPPGNKALAFSMAYFSGLFLDILLLNLLQWLPAENAMVMAVWLITGLHVMATVVIFWLWWSGRPQGQGSAKQWSGMPGQAALAALGRSPRGSTWITGLLLLVATTWVLVTALQANGLPLLAWDAWSGWVAKAKIWRHAGLGASIVSPDEWIEATGSASVYASHMWHYPDAVGLIYAFFSHFSDGVEQGSGIIWPLSGGFLAMGIYGFLIFQCRQNHSECRLIAALAVLLLLGSPLWWQHMFFAGYADILLAVYLWLAVACFALWQQTRHVAYRYMAFGFLCALPFIKLFGWFDMLLCVLVFYGIQRQKRRYALWVLAGITLLSITFWLSFPISIDSAVGTWHFTRQQWQLPGFGIIQIGRFGDISPWLEGLLFSRNWLLVWLALPVLFIYAYRLRQQVPAFTFMVLLSGSYLLVVISLYSLTSFHQFAQSFTSSNRLLLPVYPLVVTTMFWAIIDNLNRTNAENTPNK